jgi:hypothetical protein
VDIFVFPEQNSSTIKSYVILGLSQGSHWEGELCNFVDQLSFPWNLQLLVSVKKIRHHPL